MSKYRKFCERCNGELIDKGGRAQFVFHHKLKKGTEIKVTIEAPCLECTRCGSKYLPSDQGSDDSNSYYDEMKDLIDEVTSKELICE